MSPKPLTISTTYDNFFLLLHDLRKGRCGDIEEEVRPAGKHFNHHHDLIVFKDKFSGLEWCITCEAYDTFWFNQERELKELYLQALNLFGSTQFGGHSTSRAPFYGTHELPDVEGLKEFLDFIDAGDFSGSWVAKDGDHEYRFKTRAEAEVVANRSDSPVSRSFQPATHSTIPVIKDHISYGPVELNDKPRAPNESAIVHRVPFNPDPALARKIMNEATQEGGVPAPAKLYTNIFLMLRDIRKGRRGKIVEHLSKEGGPSLLTYLDDAIDATLTFRDEETNSEWVTTWGHWCTFWNTFRSEVEEVFPEVLNVFRNSTSRAPLYGGSPLPEVKGLQEFLDFIDSGDLTGSWLTKDAGDVPRARFRTRKEADTFGKGDVSISCFPPTHELLLSDSSCVSCVELKAPHKVTVLTPPVTYGVWVLTRGEDHTSYVFEEVGTQEEAQQREAELNKGWEAKRERLRRDPLALIPGPQPAFAGPKSDRGGEDTVYYTVNPGPFERIKTTAEALFVFKGGSDGHFYSSLEGAYYRGNKSVAVTCLQEAYLIPNVMEPPLEEIRQFLSAPSTEKLSLDDMDPSVHTNRDAFNYLFFGEHPKEVVKTPEGLLIHQVPLPGVGVLVFDPPLVSKLQVRPGYQDNRHSIQVKEGVKIEVEVPLVGRSAPDLYEALHKLIQTWFRYDFPHRETEHKALRDLGVIRYNDTLPTSKGYSVSEQFLSDAPTADFLTGESSHKTVLEGLRDAASSFAFSALVLGCAAADYEIEEGDLEKWNTKSLVYLVEDLLDYLEDEPEKLGFYGEHIENLFDFVDASISILDSKRGDLRGSEDLEFFEQLLKLSDTWLFQYYKGLNEYREKVYDPSAEEEVKPEEGSSSGLVGAAVLGVLGLGALFMGKGTAPPSKRVVAKDEVVVPTEAEENAGDVGKDLSVLGGR